jgi:hypothetical protein
MLLATIDSSPWYSDPHKLGALFKLVAYPLIFISALIAGWWRKRMEKIALGWPAVEGCIQFVSVAPVPKSSAFLATLQYSYFVEEYRSGEYTEGFDSEHDADEFVKKMKDQKVPVRYNPKDPDKSLIEEADVEQYIQLPPPPTLARLA